MSAEPKAETEALPKPAPTPDRLSLAYWEAALEGRLVCPECTACGLWFFRPELACPRCLSLHWRWGECAGTGVIESLTTIHRPPHPAIEVPLILASIRLDEGPYLLTNIVGDRERAAIGTPVRAVFTERRGQFMLPQFEPLPEGRWATHAGAA